MANKYLQVENVRALEDEAYKLFEAIRQIYSAEDAPDPELNKAIWDCVSAMHDCDFALQHFYKKRKLLKGSKMRCIKF
jgi:hypothetical protein